MTFRRIVIITQRKRNMKHYGHIGILVLLFVFILLGSCTKDTPTAPVVPSIDDCERYHTAEVTFANLSNSNTTYDVIWDGSWQTSIVPGETSQTYTVASGTHTLEFRVTNTNRVCCSKGYPVLADCEKAGWSCSW